jgi:hypothetical protein
VIGKMEFDPKGDIKQQMDHGIYKWDAKRNYIEINPKGRNALQTLSQHQAPRRRVFACRSPKHRHSIASTCFCWCA